MPVYIFEPDAIDKIAAIEGKAWKLDDDRSSDYTFAANKKDWTEFDAQSDLDEHDRDMYSHPSIYGSGGWNRYFVRGDGEIVFSRYHALKPDHIVLAESLGFRIG